MPKYPAWIRAKQRDKWNRRRLAAIKYATELRELRYKYEDQTWSDDNLKQDTIDKLQIAILKYLDIRDTYQWMLENLSGG